MQKRKHPVFIATQRISAVDRVAAKAVDVLIAGAVFSLGNAIAYTLGVVLCVTFLFLQDGWGQSVGKHLFGLRVLEDGTDRPASPGQSALRNLPFGLAMLFAAVPALWVFFVLAFVPLLVLEFYFVIRLDSGVRLGDVLAETYLCDKQRRPERRLEPPTLED